MLTKMYVKCHCSSKTQAHWQTYHLLCLVDPPHEHLLRIHRSWLGKTYHPASYPIVSHLLHKYWFLYHQNPCSIFERCSLKTKFKSWRRLLIRCDYVNLSILIMFKYVLPTATPLECQRFKYSGRSLWPRYSNRWHSKGVAVIRSL